MAMKNSSRRSLQHPNETDQHRQMKQAVVELYDALDWYVFTERQRTDVLACKCRAGRLFKVGIETERTTRHVLQNAARDFANGCDIVLFVALTPVARRAIRRKIAGNFPPEVSRKVAVTTLQPIADFVNRMRRRLPTGGP